MVPVAGERFEALHEQRLAHGIQLGTERVQQGDGPIGRQGGILGHGQVGRRDEGVVHRFVESTADENAGQFLAQRFGVGVGPVGQAHLHPARQRDVVIPVDAEHFLHHVRRPRHIPAVGRSAEVQSLLVLPIEGEVEIGQDALHAVAVEGHANEGVQGGPVQPDGGRARKAIAFEGLHAAFHLGAREFAEQVHGELQSRPGGLWVDSPLEPERGVRAQGVPLGTFADGHGLEPRTFEEHPAGAVTHA